MEFWGVEVKPGQVLKVEPGEDKVIHLSQAALGESKKDKGDSVFVHVNFHNQKLVLGSLSSGTIPQIQYDVVFEKDFELSHSWKHGSVYFCGYKAQNPSEEGGFYGESDSDEEEESDEELAIENAMHLAGKPETKAELAKVSTQKPGKAKVEPKAQVVVPKAGEEDSDEDDSEEDDSDEEGPDEDDGSEDDEMMTSDEEEVTPTPKKPEAGKKRASEAVTPASTKKAKVATPQKTDGKKAGPHVATPHPAKQAGKTPASKTQTPKSCETCSKTFNSEQALSSHSKAKHGAK